MSGSIAFTPREAEVVTLLAEGLTTSEVNDRLGTTVSSRHLANAKGKTGVTTIRALVYQSFTDNRIARPAPVTTENRLSELEELVWAGLRFDILDSQLPGALSQLARTTGPKVKGVLADLRARHRTTYCGLIARGFALGLLSGCEGTRLPGTGRPAGTPLGLLVQGSARTGPWKLTGRQSQALALLPVIRSAGEAAAQMQISTTTYRNHLKAISDLVSVSCLRALTHRALQEGILRPPARTEHILPGLATDVATVWRGLVLDVPDKDLQAEIAAASGLKETTVHAALGELRARGEADWQLVARGWASGVITAQEGTGRIAPDGALTAPREPRPAALGHAPRGPGRRALPTDRLRLLPDAPVTRAPRPQGGVAASVAQDVRVGRDIDLVLVTPDVCRQLLAGLHPAEWGPVVARVEAGTALLLTSPGVLRDGWRARYGRLWSRGSTVTLPPETLPAPDGAYWAVSRHAPRWDPARLEQLLNHLPPRSQQHSTDRTDMKASLRSLSEGPSHPGPGRQPYRGTALALSPCGPTTQADDRRPCPPAFRWDPVMKDHHTAFPDLALTTSQREVAEHLVAGKTPDQLPRNGTTATDQTIARLQANLSVLTVRAMCFRLLALGLLPTPGPYAALPLDPVIRAAWEALRWDILDVDLVPTVASGLSICDDLRLSDRAVDGALDRLTERFETTRHGLIRVGFAHGVLSADQSVAPPAHAFAAPTPPGVGAWDAPPAHRRVLALRASGRNVAACAMADGTTVDAVTGRLSASKQMAGGVRTHRTLIHRAMCDGVLQRPTLQRDADPSEQMRTVWRHFALDEPDNALASRIGTHTGLGMNIVDRCMWDLRTRYRDDCAVVYEGWRHGVLDADTPTDLTCCTAPAPSAAGVR